MDTDKTRAIISIAVIFCFLGTGVFFAVYPAVVDISPGQQGYIEHFQTFSSFYSGIVGTILGFYFGRGRDGKGKPDA